MDDGLREHMKREHGFDFAPMTVKIAGLVAHEVFAKRSHPAISLFTETQLAASIAVGIHLALNEQKKKWEDLP